MFPFKNFTELPTADFFLQDVFVNDLWHSKYKQSLISFKQSMPKVEKLCKYIERVTLGLRLRLIQLKKFYNIQISHVMKVSIIVLLIFLSIAAIHSQHTNDWSFNGEQSEITDEERIQQLQQELQSLHPHFIEHFINFYHLNSQGQDSSNENNILNYRRIGIKKATYLLLVGKMYLYGILPNNDYAELRYYNTKSNYMAAYYYLRIAAEQFENREAYYLLGILQHFKLVPDKILETNINAQSKKTVNQQILLKYLEQSHLYNSESNLYISAGMGFHPASLVLGYMNKNRLGTSKNCTAALAYYISVIKDTYVEQFYFRQVYSFYDSLEENLYSKKKISFPKSINENHFIQDTDYYDDQIIEATSQLADNYYMGSGGHLRNLTRAAKLYQKLAEGGSRHGKVMAGISYFKGQGVPVDRAKAYSYFTETSRDEISDYMILGIKYYELLEKGTKQKALSIMLQKYKHYKKSKERMPSHTTYLISSVILKGELKDKDKDGNYVVIPQAEGYQLLDSAVVQGNVFAKILLAILYTDGANGLKYGCQEAIRFFSEQALVFPYFKDRVSTAQVALNRGQTLFPLIKYMELAMIGYENAYINLLYLLEVYGESVFNMKSQSWSLKDFKNNRIYKQIRKNGFPDAQTYILKLYTIKGKPALNLNSLETLLNVDKNSVKDLHQYIRRKVIRWGSIFDKKNILKYYDYKLTAEENGNYLPILTSLASGDSEKLYVSQARYLLGKHHHKKALQNKTTLTPNEHFRILGEYNRAVKSQLFGLAIFHIEQYLLGNQSSFDFFESQIGGDLLAYIFVVSIAIFILYYLRSKRIDHFHKSELEKQLRKAAQEKEQERQKMEMDLTERLKQGGPSELIEQKVIKESQIDINQPIITEDEEQPKGIRIGSSYEENS